MFKKGDIVVGRVTGAVYEVLRDSDSDTPSRTQVKCLSSPNKHSSVTVGDVIDAFTGRLELQSAVTLPAALGAAQDVEQEESQPVDELVELRRSIKDMFNF